MYTLNSNAGRVSSVGANKAPAAYEDGTLHCVVSRSDGFRFLNNATASSIAADTTQFLPYTVQLDLFVNQNTFSHSLN